jgi:hypothetical protein
MVFHYSQVSFSPLASQPNGSSRLAEIINWPQISIRAGLNKEIMSFQRGILLLLRVRVFARVLIRILTSLLVSLLRVRCQEHDEHPLKVCFSSSFGDLLLITS